MELLRPSEAKIKELDQYEELVSTGCNRILPDEVASTVHLARLPLNQFPIERDFDEVVDLDRAKDLPQELAELEHDVNTIPHRRYGVILNGVLTPWSWLFETKQFLVFNQELLAAHELIAAEDMSGHDRLKAVIQIYNKAQEEPKPLPVGPMAISARLLKQIQFHCLDNYRAAYAPNLAGLTH